MAEQMDTALSPTGQMHLKYLTLAKADFFLTIIDKKAPKLLN